MTKEQIIECLTNDKHRGITYKKIAEGAGLKPQDIYDYVRPSNTRPLCRVAAALSDYYTKEGENK